MRPPRYLSLAVGLILLETLSAGCAPVASSTVERGPVAVVLVDAGHHARTICVDLDAEVSGRQLLELAEVPLILDERNPMGALVCAIDGQGCAYPAEPCLCRCEGLGDCAYWASFVRTPPGPWTYAGLGVSTQMIRAGDLYAWVWLPTAASSEALDWLPTGDVESVCP